MFEEGKVNKGGKNLPPITPKSPKPEAAAPRQKREVKMNIIQIYYDEDEWVALIGPNPDEGITGRSDTPVRALRELVFKLNITPWKFEMIPFMDNQAR